MRAIWWEQGGGLISPRRSLRFCHKLQSPRQGAEKLGEAVLASLTSALQQKAPFWGELGL